MSVWFFIVLVIGVVYALNRLTTTTDLPVSTRLARAREIAEGGARREQAADLQPDAVEPDQVPAAGTPGARRYCATSPAGRRTAPRTRHVVRH